MIYNSYSKFKKCALSLVLGMVLVVSSIPNAEALVINTINGGGTANANTQGTGTLTAIFDAAANVWESLIADSHTVTITYSWAALGGSTLGVHSLSSQGGTPNRETAATIRFDNDGTSTFFADSTPLNNSEYTTFNSSSADLGGGAMNTGNVWTGATGLAIGATDLFSVALHEIGHALGLSSANTSFQAGNGDLDVDITALVSSIYAGSAIPTISGAHLNLVNSLMFPSIGINTRRLISTADLLANCQISQFTQCDGAHPVSEPTPFGLLALGGLFLWLGRRRAKRAA